MHLGFSDTSIIPLADYKIVSNRLFIINSNADDFAVWSV